MLATSVIEGVVTSWRRRGRLDLWPAGLAFGLVCTFVVAIFAKLQISPSIYLGTLLAFLGLGLVLPLLMTSYEILPRIDEGHSFFSSILGACGAVLLQVQGSSSGPVPLAGVALMLALDKGTRDSLRELFLRAYATRNASPLRAAVYALALVAAFVACLTLGVSQTAFFSSALLVMPFLALSRRLAQDPRTHPWPDHARREGLRRRGNLALPGVGGRRQGAPPGTRQPGRIPSTGQRRVLRVAPLREGGLRSRPSCRSRPWGTWSRWRGVRR